MGRKKSAPETQKEEPNAARKSRKLDVEAIRAKANELGGVRGELLAEKITGYEGAAEKTTEAKADLKFAAKELRRSVAFLCK
jgi:hypothetical protein